MKRLAIVPARGGSKRLPNKHLLRLGDKALITHTVDVVRRHFDLAIVTSDSSAILREIAAAENVVCDLRPTHLASDTSTVIHTVSYYFARHSDSDFDQIWLCLPTCPFRTDEDVVGAQQALVPSVDGVVSVTEYEFPPSLGLTLTEGLLTGFDETHPLARGDSRSQDQRHVYRPNGALYGMWWGSFQQHHNFFRGKVTPWVMPRARSIDVDTELDFVIAKCVYASQHLYRQGLERR